ncbi:MAG: 30S ribosomal protein S7 [Nitrospinae bacterium RIFCSPLOWO2_02_FULL_39_110]|nr:MAG: 30S ribosomal protein S7 [Nitrospinae bacterium RIFCSPHIGHO2_02_39_11]OGV98235.1 MAG: 30S ribosomal protein S7 [Nitrospinae bacterium RIFCSPHIGHO2_12_FULL_39_42]OGW00259.1 MAG: 30S ribosomal protein S7 [Nitrospinae bacterium RIFCSPHIGHO2_02_FULL_39_82]OGW03552.1 MAG: 30S ribosomal protein S7 [Nitrospinae bacterium RIFCSPLOWO2_02_39_17]OGW04221.1 MAG: 30S ribosomal protein S7 [Nitrospinae bacterium RIFCSPLOWO2_02_FULL_39_110]OGW09394.1 MAG: 30S ribosomal protein S7 [Nitrospinae bacteriu
MARRKVTIKRVIIPDLKYDDPVIAKMINIIMREGKKSQAESIVYNALELIKKKVKDEPLKVFKKAIDNVKPLLEVKPKRVGGATYQVPVEVRQERKIALSIRWIVSSARARGEKTMQERLAAEILDAFNKTGTAIKKREDTHKMAEANRAFAHYRW